VTYPDSAIDKISVELAGLAKGYAEKAATLASDPYFKEAVMKASVSGFVWALYQAFPDDFSKRALSDELKVQCTAIDRAVGGRDEATH
jgi:hypothetical protein